MAIVSTPWFCLVLGLYLCICICIFLYALMGEVMGMASSNGNGMDDVRARAFPPNSHRIPL